MNCVMCGAPLPDGQGSNTCSMCYGDVDHGQDDYYRAYMERWEQEHRYREQEGDLSDQQEGEGK